MDTKNIYLAIDLGTTNTVLAYGRKNVFGFFDTEVLRIPQLDQNQNIQSKELLPSVFYKDNKERKYVGEIGKWMRDYNSSRVIYNSKRYMGTDYKWNMDGEVITPRDVAGEILKMCRSTASRYFMRDDIKEVTITVPASFNHDQTRDTIEAAVAAGFDRDKIEIISEPTAALIDFINRQSMVDEADRLVDFSETKRIMVFDIGGGTCDVSIIDVGQDGKEVFFKEKAVGRYDEFGGVDFDTWTANYLLNKFLNENCIEPESIKDEELKEMKNKLVIFSEKAKEYISSQIENYLSLQMAADFENIEYSQGIPEFYDDKMYSFSITKKEFDKATNDLYYKPQKTIKDHRELAKYKNLETPILNTLKDYNIDSSSIDYVFLTGGISKYIKIQERIKELLKKPIIMSPYPMESVSRGAAVYHYYSVKMTKSSEAYEPTEIEKGDEMDKVIDVTKVLAEAIMIDVNDGLPTVIIPANHPIPSTNEPYRDMVLGKLRTTSPAGIKIDIYAGKDPYDSKLRIQRSYQGRFSVPVRTGTPIDIEYSLDKNKYLSMRVIVNDDIKQEIEIGIESDVTFIND